MKKYDPNCCNPVIMEDEFISFFLARHSFQVNSVIFHEPPSAEKMSSHFWEGGFRPSTREVYQIGIHIIEPLLRILVHLLVYIGIIHNVG